MFSNIEGMYYKREIRNFIYKAETNAVDVGDTEQSLLIAFAKAIKKVPYVSKELYRIEREIGRNKAKYKIYKPFMDREVTAIIKESEVNKLGLAEVFKSFVPSKELGEKILMEIKFKLIVPIVMFVFAVMALNGVLEVYMQIINDGYVTLKGPLKFFAENYYSSMSAIGVLAVFLLIVIPKKLPIIRGVFLRVEALLVMSLISTMSNMGYQAGAIRKSIIRIFEIEIKDKEYKDDIEALMHILSTKKYLSLEEGAMLNVYAENGKIMEGIRDISNLKKEAILGQREIINEIVSKVGLLLLSPPLLLIILIMSEVINGVN